MKTIDIIGRDAYEPTGVVVKCTGEGRHNNEVGTVYSKGNALYIKFGGIYVKRDSLIERGYTLTSYQGYAQSAF